MDCINLIFQPKKRRIISFGSSILTIESKGIGTEDWFAPKSSALLAFFTGARRMYHSSRSPRSGKESSVCYNLYGDESHMLVENCSGIH
ncbi:conserved hypothetical protein [Ricinus communis]|uniref:Uncharacterized protein n=1 Tax=Ricinus communis TaxID=3988 RepID=B9TB13_RICCO|nr:conserved hypothetical protein [Ricinus communis]EEF26949.1 conserved hypothetical protein [Ricinus communis]